MNSKRYKGMFLSIFGVGLLYLVSFCYGHYMQQAFQSRSILFADEITEAARLHDISPALITAIIHAESNFNPNARSNAGAKGLMQINTPTQRYLKIGNVFDPSQNVEAGARYIKELLVQFDGDLTLALAAYNAGPGAVRRFNGIPPYSETKNYVKKVMAYYHQYRQAFVSGSILS